MKKSFLTFSLILGLTLAHPGYAANQTAVFAGGCFWGVDAVFKHVKGVTAVVSGYTGGTAETARYELVSNGNTGHAEAVQVSFDPARVSYPQLLDVFFKVVHDPTQLNRQGPDVGTQYRSAIFYTGPEQQQQVQNYTRTHNFPAPVVTQVVPLKVFYPKSGSYPAPIANN